MRDETIKAIGRLTAWVRDYGDQKQPTFIADIKTVLEAAENWMSVRLVPTADNLATKDDLLDPAFTGAIAKGIFETPIPPLTFGTIEIEGDDQ